MPEGAEEGSETLGYDDHGDRRARMRCRCHRAAALAALAPIGLNAIVESGRLVAVVGALSAFWPRPYGAIDLGGFRAGYLIAEPDFARLQLIDARIGVAENPSRALLWKLVRLHAVMGALAAAAILMGMGVVIDWPTRRWDLNGAA